ncbi:hypothetical protein BO86DRAFT_28396 [Aspergillus japonicus CBS 114.51]|uniref:Uncharacterized protein n=1 Tax=Aspergillus japonicus CBS 114.51 TaxID=1448312 RepID=A0A8T8WK00_ASPJA|nr:hypothetical protein BO86DRAFT_28396 [Aspergillus japonicus CBS 114.51]RAH76155.1 hypothetical protein BO86DRAFT_28396 [Aspergillus japonicus CBS 114.51]
MIGLANGRGGTKPANAHCYSVQNEWGMLMMNIGRFPFHLRCQYQLLYPFLFFSSLSFFLYLIFGPS